MARQISMATRQELIAAVGSRYRASSRSERRQILAEFVAVTGYHRKHAIRVLAREPAPGPGPQARSCHRLYDEAVRQALIVLWEASDRICGKRLKAALPLLIGAMEQHGHLALDPTVKQQLLSISAATIDRLLSATREQASGGRKRRSGVGSAIRRSVPIRTFADWKDPPPGYFEADMVEHCGGTKQDGNFVHSLVLTDIATGWTECVALLVREQTLIVQGFAKVRSDLPFAMRGLDTDNDSAFMNETVLGYCQAQGLELTRSRAYKKNDQAWVEQKNGAIVRRLVGYGRLSGLPATRALAQLYAVSRLYINFFQPSFKLKSKTREGARVTKRYHAPMTPCERLLSLPSVDEAIKAQLRSQLAQLDPVRLLHDIRAAQHELAAFAAQGSAPATGCASGAGDILGRPVECLEGRRGPAHAPEERQRASWVAHPRGPLRAQLAHGATVAGSRAGRLGQGADGALGGDVPRPLHGQSAASHLAAPRQGLARRAGEGAHLWASPIRCRA